MERFETLSVIRQRLLVHCGYASSEALNGQLNDRHLEYIRQANEAVQTLRQWKATESEYEFTYGVGQRFYNYPPNCDAGCVNEVGIWSNKTATDAGFWFPLRKTRIPLYLDQTPILDAGGDPALQAMAMPTRYAVKKQLEVWPPADVAYLGKITYWANPELLLDEDVSQVDSEAILYHACASELEKMGDSMASEKMEAKFKARVALLSAWQHTGETVTIDQNASYHEDKPFDPFFLIEKRP